MKRSFRQNVPHHLSLPQDLGFSIEVEKHASRIMEVGDARPFLDAEVVAAILRNAIDFSEQVQSPLCNAEDGSRTLTHSERKQAYTALFNEGWSGVSLSQEHGGLGLPAILRAPLLEILRPADPELWDYVDTSVLVAGIIARLSNDTLKKLFIPKIRDGEWAILLEADTFQKVPVLAQAVQQDDGLFRLWGTAHGSAVSLGLASKEFRLVKAIQRHDGNAHGEPALFLIPYRGPGESDNAGVLGWHAASMHSAKVEWARLANALTLRTAAGSAPLARPMGSAVEAWRAVALAYARAMDLAERHADEKVRLDSRRFMGIASRILESRRWDPQWTAARRLPGADALIREAILPDGGAAFRTWLTQVYQTVARLDSHPFAGCARISSSLRSGAESLQSSMDVALERGMPSPCAQLDPAGSIFSQFFNVMACTEIANSALYAAQCMPSTRWDARYLQRKLDAALRFATHALPTQAKCAAST